MIDWCADFQLFENYLKKNNMTEGKFQPQILFVSLSRVKNRMVIILKFDAAGNAAMRWKHRNARIETPFKGVIATYNDFNVLKLDCKNMK